MEIADRFNCNCALEVVTGIVESHAIETAEK